jgi:hypothetical protein
LTKTEINGKIYNKETDIMINLNDNTRIKQLYDQLSEQLLLVYTNMSKNQDFDIDKNLILVSFDAFFQCSLVKAVLHKRKFEVGEVNFIKNLVKFADYFSDIYVLRDTYPSSEVEKQLYELSTNYLKQVPEVATMSILVDHEIESSILKSKITFSKMLYNCFFEIVTIVIDDTEDNYPEKVLSPLKDFFARNQVLEFSYNE